MEKKIKLELSYTEVATLVEALGYHAASVYAVNNAVKTQSLNAKVFTAVEYAVAESVACKGLETDWEKWGAVYKWLGRCFDRGFIRLANLRMIWKLGEEVSAPHLFTYLGKTMEVA